MVVEYCDNSGRVDSPCSFNSSVLWVLLLRKVFAIFYISSLFSARYYLLRFASHVAPFICKQDAASHRYKCLHSS